MADNIEIIAALRDLISTPAGAATASLQRLENQLEDLNREFIAGRISQDEYVRGLHRVSRTSRLAGRDSRRFRREIEKHEIALGSKGFRGWLKRASSALGTFGDAFGEVLSNLMQGPVKLLAIGAAFSVLIPIVGALSGGLLALAGFWGPVVGLLAGVPGLALGAAAGIGVLVIAFNGIGEAVKVLADANSTMEQIAQATKDLSPEAKNFAVTLANIVPRFKRIRDAVQQSLLPTLGGVLQKLADTYIPFFEGKFVQIAERIGKVFTSLEKLTTSAGFIKDMNKLWDSTAKITERLGMALVHALSAIRGVMVAAIPLAEKMSIKIHEMFASFDQFANSAAGRTAMVDFFNRAWTAATNLWHIIRDFAAGLWNIMDLGAGLGEGMATSLEDTAAKFRAWTNSVAGETRIAQFFKDIKQTLTDLGELFGAIAKEFLKLGTGAGEQKSSQSFLDGLTAAVPTVFKFIEGLIKVAGFIGTVLQKLGPMGTLILAVAGAVGWLVSAFAPLWPIIQPIFTRLLPWLARLVLGFSNPVGIIVMLIALFITLYKNSETVRNAIDGLGRAFMDSMGWIKDKILDPIGGAIMAIVDAIKRIDFPSPPDWIKNGVLGFGDGKDNFGWGREHGGPVWPGQQFTVGEAGRELFMGKSGVTSIIGSGGEGQMRFNEPGVVIPNPVTEAIMAGATAAPMPSRSGSSSSSADYAAALPAISVDARGFSQAEATSMIAAAIRMSRNDAETRYSRKKG